VVASCSKKHGIEEGVEVGTGVLAFCKVGITLTGSGEQDPRKIVKAR
jgi:hypothetical protein